MRDLGGGMHHAIQIQEEMKLICDELKAMKTTFEGRSTDSIDNTGGGTSSDGQNLNVIQAQLHYYGGRYCILKPLFKMPTLTLHSFISHYFFGNRDEGIPPLRLITTSDLIHSSKEDGSKVNTQIVPDIKKMMWYVEKAGRDAEVWENDPAKWTNSKITNLYEKTKHRFMVPGKKSKRRFEAILWKTYLNILKANHGLMPVTTSL